MSYTYAERTEPVSVAYQALTELRESLEQLCFRDRDEITEELRSLVRDLDESRWRPFGATLAPCEIRRQDARH